MATASGRVEVGFCAGIGRFNDTVALDGTTTLDLNALTFSATGAVSAVIGGTTTKLLDGSRPSASRNCSAARSMKRRAPSTFKVGGATFTLSSLSFTNAGGAQIQLQGSLALPQGITIAVDKTNV